MTKDIEREAFEALQSPIIFERIIYLETENLYIAKEAFQFDIFTATKCNELNFGWEMWQAAKAHEAKKLEGCVVVPVELSDEDADRLACNAFEQSKDCFYSSHRDLSATEREQIRLRWTKNKARTIQQYYKLAIEAARGGNE